MKRSLTSLASAVLLASAVHAEAIEREYLDAVILLVDHEKGWMGISLYDEATGKESRQTLKADPADVFVTNPMNRHLDFEDIQTGERVNLYSEIKPDGSEIVTTIVSYRNE